MTPITRSEGFGVAKQPAINPRSVSGTPVYKTVIGWRLSGPPDPPAFGHEDPRVVPPVCRHAFPRPNRHDSPHVAPPGEPSAAHEQWGGPKPFRAFSSFAST